MTESSTPILCGRRAALLAAGATGVAALTACGGSGDAAGTASSVASQASSNASKAVSDLIKSAEIPVGGGKVFADAGVIVTQPVAGTFKAFTTTCTHQGSQIDSVHDGVMECPTHHSEFSIKDGAVVQGPATGPLPEKKVTVSGDGISVT